MHNTNKVYTTAQGHEFTWETAENWGELENCVPFSEWPTEALNERVGLFLDQAAQDGMLDSYCQGILDVIDEELAHRRIRAMPTFFIQQQIGYMAEMARCTDNWQGDDQQYWDMLHAERSRRQEGK